ncbi:MAG: tyrosine-type recombinase/integrase [Candidatus Gorgyraea atricola]|nr:tyrosine-type recombinase/integrase [Candidatus Gorgyraea atricola]
MTAKKFGDLYRRKDSSVWWMWYYDAKGKRRQESTKTDDKELARRKLLTRLTEHQALRTGEKAVSDMPYLHFAEEFLKHYKARYPYETFKSHRSCINEFMRFLDLVGLNLLSEITTAVIDKYITYLRESKGNRANTCNNHLKNLCTQFNFAIRHNLVKDNPAKGCKKVEVNDAKQKSALSPLEYQAFMAATKKMYLFYFPIYYTFIHTGLRFTELIKLKWQDIDFENKVLWVMQPKCKKKPDYISMHDGLIKVLDGLKKKSRSEYVFTTEDGIPFGIRTRKIIRRLKEILKKANITGISTIHELRHTHCSLLFNAGLNTKEIMEQMRHTELRTTEGYAHIFRPEANRKIKKLERLDR